MVRLPTFPHNRSSRFSDTFEDEGDALADADAHGAEGVTAIGAEELVKRGGDEARAAGTERMTDGDGAAIRVDVWGIVGQTEIAQDGEGLRSEGFVAFDAVHLGELQRGSREDFARGRRGR